MVVTTRRRTCSVDGCNMQTRGKMFCVKHIKNKGKTPAITAAARSLMRSGCCNAPCTQGKRHEYGEQYCDKCKQPCPWRNAV